jgi:hypothetical protein
LVFWVNATARGALISKLVAFHADVSVTTLLPGVLALPASSNSTVKEKVWGSGVMLAETVVAARVAVFSTSGDVQGVFTLGAVLRNPAGSPGVLLMHHW